MRGQNDYPRSAIGPALQETGASNPPRRVLSGLVIMLTVLVVNRYVSSLSRPLDDHGLDKQTSLVPPTSGTSVENEDVVGGVVEARG